MAAQETKEEEEVERIFKRYREQYFKSQPTDVLLITLPKSGTTWLKALIFSIVNRTRYDNSNHPLLTQSPHVCVPFLDVDLFCATPVPAIENMPSPRLFACHIPYTSLPESIISSGCRIVYICRNPKDVFTSLWHFSCKVRTSINDLPPLSLDDTFDLFCKGVSPFGPFWDHVLGYWKASLQWPNRVLFLNYEEMKKEHLVHVNRLADFLDHPFSLEEDKEGVVQEIIRLCSFENLRNLEVNKTGRTLIGGANQNSVVIENSVFFREGKVGDSENLLTAQMNDLLDQIMKEKLDDSHFSF
ncbi:hypothetical protein F0562_025041 [Nyssa sinensis]|uniref:Sulfotransferase n=1 Tax=Nyssa sinensis TaxID=561372 RepID=A0A5J5BEN8_9ASTE|nr:hypothetical protein F0562_025041 [Nyssa sinensis]